MTKKEVQEYIFLAVQSGKKETSELVVHLEKVMDRKLGEGIEKYVNGHLRDIRSDIKDVKEHLEAQDDILAGLKNDTAPVIEAQKTVISLRKFIIWLGGIILAILALLKLISKA